MTYAARGHVDLASTPEIEIELENSRARFILTSDLTADEITDFKRQQGSTRVDLARFAGFDISDSDFSNGPVDENGRFYHSLRFDGSYDDHRMSLVVEHFASLGMGVYGDLMGEDGLNWVFEAEFGSRDLANDNLVSIRSERLKIYQEREALLVKAAEALQQCLEENNLMKYKAKAFDDVVNILGYEPEEVRTSISRIVDDLGATHTNENIPKMAEAVILLGQVGQILLRGMQQVSNQNESEPATF
jgi:hypothetical protein